MDRKIIISASNRVQDHGISGVIPMGAGHIRQGGVWGGKYVFEIHCINSKIDTAMESYYRLHSLIDLKITLARIGSKFWSLPNLDTR